MKGKCREKHRRRLFRFKSFRVQMALTFIALTAICVLATIFIAKFYLIKYYTSEQVDKIGEIFDNVNKTASSERFVKGHYWFNDNISQRLDIISAKENVDIILVDPDIPVNKVLFSSGTSNYGTSLIVESITGYVLGESDNNLKVNRMRTTDRYVVYRALDDYLKSTNIDLLGKLDNGVYCFVRINYESIENTATMISNYYAFVALIIIFIEALVIMIMLRKFIRPLESMKEVAKRMRNLDFEAKAEANFDNEFGELATTLNSLSETLNKTILELKNANNELTKDIEKHKELDEMRKEFLDAVSHELKTPIAIIQGYAEGLSENVLDTPEDRQYYCDVIADEAAKMNNMVKKLLTLSRMEHGTNPLEIERFDVVPLIKGLLETSEVLAGDREIVVQFDDSASHYVYADEFMIEESISNYISNAYHHVDGDNIIRVSIEEGPTSTRVIVFNSGSSIPEEDLENVWLKFFKVDKARTREYGGSGIGLSIVKAIMDGHHQECGVRNVEGGVEFYLDLDNCPVKPTPLERGNDDSNN